MIRAVVALIAVLALVVLLVVLIGGPLDPCRHLSNAGPLPCQTDR